MSCEAAFLLQRITTKHFMLTGMFWEELPSFRTEGFTFTGGIAGLCKTFKTLYNLNGMNSQFKQNCPDAKKSISKIAKSFDKPCWTPKRKTRCWLQKMLLWENRLQARSSSGRKRKLSVRQENTLTAWWRVHKSQSKTVGRKIDGSLLLEDSLHCQKMETEKVKRILEGVKE